MQVYIQLTKYCINILPFAPSFLISSSKVQRLLKWIEKDTHSKIFNFNLCKSQVADPLWVFLYAGAGVIAAAGHSDGVRERRVGLDLAQQLPSVVDEVVPVCLGEVCLGEELSSEERGIVLGYGENIKKNILSNWWWSVAWVLEKFLLRTITFKSNGILCNEIEEKFSLSYF